MLLRQRFLALTEGTERNRAAELKVNLLPHDVVAGFGLFLLCWFVGLGFFPLASGYYCCKARRA